ncbi:MAG: DsbA family protein [Bifidobacteriaceae bacterium]|jgi:hypothetical protein|nr:DsbA family protein [Bifidobacteriaceae bacterium]
MVNGSHLKLDEEGEIDKKDYLKIKSDDFACQFYFRSANFDRSKGAEITIFLDFQCSNSAKFFSKYTIGMYQMMQQGVISVRIVPLIWVEPSPGGHHYPIRAANKARVVLRFQPKILWQFLTFLLHRDSVPGLYEDYDLEKGSDEAIAKLAYYAGASEKTIYNIMEYRHSKEFTDRIFLQSAILRYQKCITQTPTVYIDDLIWNNRENFLNVIQKRIKYRKNKH